MTFNYFSTALKAAIKNYNSRFISSPQSVVEFSSNLGEGYEFDSFVC